MTEPLHKQLQKVMEALEQNKRALFVLGFPGQVRATEQALTTLQSVISDVEDMERELEASNRLRGPGTTRAKNEEA
jgi:hypothetical protein